MKYLRTTLMTACHFLLGLALHLPAFAGREDDFYTQTGTDPIFAEVMKSGKLPRGKNSKNGFTGSEIKVNHDLLEDSPNAHRPLIRDIEIHTLGSTSIKPKDFPKWSRWYQEDGNTQVFRLFKDEENVRNSRQFAARIEANSTFGFKKGDGWQEWAGTYTIIKPTRCCIFQSKNSVNDWSVMINMNDDGDVRINSRRGEDKVLAENMTGKPFHLRIRDDGHNYEVYFNGKKEGEGSFERPKGHTGFRWGMYLGAKPVRSDAMILVTGAVINPSDSANNPGADSHKKTRERVIGVRTWTDADGQTVRAQARYEIGNEEIEFFVNGQWIKYPISRLSLDDRKFLTSGEE